MPWGSVVPFAIFFSKFQRQHYFEEIFYAGCGRCLGTSRMCATSTEGWCCPGWRRLLETLHLWGWWWWRCGDDWIVLGLVDSWCSALVDDSSCHTLMLMLTTVWSRFFFLFHDSLTHVMLIFDRLLWAKLYSQEALPVWAAEADAEVRPVLRQQPQILHHHREQPPGHPDECECHVNQEMEL